MWFTPVKNVRKLQETFESTNQRKMSFCFPSQIFISLLQTLPGFTPLLLRTVRLYPTSVPQVAGVKHCREQLEGSPSNLKGSEGIQPQGWGCRCFKLFPVIFFLRMTIRSQDLGGFFCVAFWPTESWFFFFLMPVALRYSFYRSWKNLPGLKGGIGPACLASQLRALTTAYGTDRGNTNAFLKYFFLSAGRNRNGKNNFKKSAFYLQLIPCLHAGKPSVCDSSLCPGGKLSWETPNTAEIFLHTKPDGFSAYCVPGQVLVLAAGGWQE